MIAAAPFSPTRRDIWIAIAIVLLAWGLRVVVVFDRAAQDYYWQLRPGYDQTSYVNSARSYAQGEWPRGAFYFQPGFIYYLIGIQAIGGDNLGMMRLLTSLTGALSCGVMIGAGWLLTRRRWGGYLAGGLLAVYPVAIFWSTALLIPVLATFLLSLFLWLALWQREALSIWRTLGLGLLTGLLLITRSNLVPAAVIWLVYLAFIAGNRHTFARHTTAFLLAAALPVAPVTLWNIQHGSSQLVSGTGWNEVYRGNNRDATGLRLSSTAEDVATNYREALFNDILRDPLHFIELQIRKTALYWSDHEPGNNLDYNLSGERVSPLLRTIPLGFRLLGALGLLGLVVLWIEDWRLSGFLLLVNGLILAGVLLLWVEGRLRQPAVVPLILSGAYFLSRIPDLLTANRWRVLVVPALVLAGVFNFSDWALDNLPRKHPVAGLPADLRPLDLVFDDTIRLLGWRALPDFAAADEGWTYPGRVYVVELYWELLEKTDADYNFYLAYVDDGERYMALDRLIGGVSFQPTPTSSWEPGNRYAEIAGFRFPSDKIPTGRSGEIEVGVYLLDEERRITDVPITAPETAQHYAILQRFALVDAKHQDEAPPAMTTSELVFGSEGGDQLALLGYAIPVVGEPAEPVTLSFYWQALGNIRADYNLFIHVMDANDQLAAQYDGPPRAGVLVTSTWPDAAPIRDDIPLTLPDKPGTYTVYIGLYHHQTHDRLPVDAPDYRPLLGTITVES